MALVIHNDRSCYRKRNMREDENPFSSKKMDFADYMKK
jgi:hypothetical protein